MNILSNKDIAPLSEADNTIRQLNLIHNFAEQTALMGSYSYHFSSGKYTYSDNMYRLLGYEPGEFEPVPEVFYTMVHPDDTPYLLREYQKFVTEGQTFPESLFRIRKKNSEFIHVKTSGVVLGYEDEKVFIGAMCDVTYEHNKEQLLIKQNIQLEKINKELASFSFIASHDLQEPLRKISTFVEMIYRNDYDVLSEKGKVYFERIASASARMQQLIKDILSYSQTGSGEAHLATVNLNDLLNDVLDLMKEKIEQRNAVIEADRLPQLKVIPVQFEQLIINLVSNSLKYCKEGKAPHIRIQYSLTSKHTEHTALPGLMKKRYHHFTFSDNGIGFDPEHEERIFGLFQKLHARHEYDGTGIGLAICKKIVDNHNGIINARSVAGEGASFHVYIPAE